MSVPTGRLKRRSLWAIPAIAALVIGVVWILTIALVNSEHEAEVKDEYRNNANLAQAFDEHTRRTLHGVDQIVLMVKYVYERKGRSTDLGALVRTGILGRRNALLGSVGVADEHGDLILSSAGFTPTNLAGHRISTRMSRRIRRSSSSAPRSPDPRQESR
jgi:hypothetical protein